MYQGAQFGVKAIPFVGPGIKSWTSSLPPDLHRDSPPHTSAQWEAWPRPNIWLCGVDPLFGSVWSSDGGLPMGSCFRCHREFQAV